MMQPPVSRKNIAAFLALVFMFCCLAGFCYYIISDKTNKLEAARQVNEQQSEQISKLNGEIMEKDAQIARQQSENAALQAKIDEQTTTIADIQLQLNKADAKLKKNAAKASAEAITANAGMGAAAVTGTGKICYLTFDDGPSASTPALLNTLEQLGVKATFFVVGTAYLDDYLYDIYADGHAIGLHCNSHVWSEVYASADGYYADLQTISDKVFKYIGKRTDIIRFPGGSSNAVSKKYCPGIMTAISAGVEQSGYKYFDWNVVSGDASGIRYSAAQLAKNVVNAAKNKTEICVLMHDAKSKATTIQALPAMVAQLRAMGFEFRTMDSSCNGFHQTVKN